MEVCQKKKKSDKEIEKGVIMSETKGTEHARQGVYMTKESECMIGPGRPMATFVKVWP